MTQGGGAPGSVPAASATPSGGSAGDATAKPPGGSA
jgi:hypothetical protein